MDTANFLPAAMELYAGAVAVAVEVRRRSLSLWPAVAGCGGLWLCLFMCWLRLAMLLLSLLAAYGAFGRACGLLDAPQTASNVYCARGAVRAHPRTASQPHPTLPDDAHGGSSRRS